MKKSILTIATLALMFSCGTPKDKVTFDTKLHPAWSDDAVMYEMNIRQFTPEGTINAAATHLPRLKDMGVGVIWVMPVQPIGELQRKGSLGSYYAIKDYTDINPEFGTKVDMQNFIKQAHSLGIKVIQDWVANHTAPDHPWTANEGWHLRDSVGGLVVRYDWTDIAELDYDNKAMRSAMQNAMVWWVDSMGVDGFRCDVAMEVPTEFWNETIDILKAKNPEIFMLAEAEQPDLTEKAFDVHYGWELHHQLNALAKGEISADSVMRYFAKYDTIFQQSANRLNFTSNHDENSWSGTEFERMGDAVRSMAAFTFLVPGMPLIYTGQEAANPKRLRFFEKDTVQWNDTFVPMYKSLSELRHTNSALHSAPWGGRLVQLATNKPQQVIAFERTVADNSVVAVFNMSADVQQIVVDTPVEGTNWIQYPENTPFDSSKLKNLILKPWSYLIITRNID